MRDAAGTRAEMRHATRHEQPGQHLFVTEDKEPHARAQTDL